VEGCWTCSWWTLSRTYCAWQRPLATRPTTFHVWKTTGCQCSFRLLMIRGVSPETCWASYKYVIINFDTLLHLVGFSLWIHSPVQHKNMELKKMTVMQLRKLLWWNRRCLNTLLPAGPTKSTKKGKHSRSWQPQDEAIRNTRSKIHNFNKLCSKRELMSVRLNMRCCAG
jgi:hypothetical protein